jgi:SAF domain-containing protein
MTSTAMPRSTARLRRIDLRVVIGLALLLAGVVGTVAVVQRAGQRVPVLVVAREVPAGQVLGDQDVRVAELGLAHNTHARGPCQRFARNCATHNLTSPHPATLDSPR